VIKEDPIDENILYLGNDQGVYMTFNMGENWKIMDNSIPRVAVHDLVIQNTAKDLVIATHGRSIYKTNIAAFQHYQKVKNKALEIFDLKDINYSNDWGNSWSSWEDPMEPELEIQFFVSSVKKIEIQIKSDDNIILNTLKVDTSKGFNYKDYDLSFSEEGLKSFQKKHKDINLEKKKNEKYYLPKGKYRIVIQNISKEFKIK
jgi:hypothetical protein